MNHLKKMLSKFIKNYLQNKIKFFTKYKFIRYLLVGFTNSTVCFFTMYVGYLLDFHYLTYTAIGYVVAIFYSFFMNLRFTFKVEGQIVKRLTLFFVINFTNLGIVEIIEYILIDICYLNRLFSILCAMSWYVITGFLINNYWVYSRKLV